MSAGFQAIGWNLTKQEDVIGFLVLRQQFGELARGGIQRLVGELAAEIAGSRSGTGRGGCSGIRAT